jgi:pyruvate/2-oxoglutarate dehydrogenase complex dihydrolipoamide dehydrogenase (E3) component
VGLTEGEARRRGLDVDVRKAAFGESCGTDGACGIGFVKALFRETAFWAAVVGPSAGELTGALVLPVAAGMKRRELQACVLPHPSLIEILGDLFS